MDSIPHSKEERIQRQARCLLDKLCSENLQEAVEELARIDLDTSAELETVVRAIFDQALLEPQFCETFADMVFVLEAGLRCSPLFEEFHPFLRILSLSICQDIFESFGPTAEESKTCIEERSLEMGRRKANMSALLSLIGELVRRELLPPNVVAQIVHELIGPGDQPPEEHMVECACELIERVGCDFDEVGAGMTSMQKMCDRLVDLQSSESCDKCRIYTKHCQWVVQDLLDLRSRAWEKENLTIVQLILEREHGCGHISDWLVNQYNV